MRRCWTVVVANLLWAAPAAAWDHEPASQVALPAAVFGVAVLPMDDPPAVVLAMGAQVSWIVDPVRGTSLRTLPVGGRDAVLADLDGDGQREALLCGPGGVYAIAWDGRYGGIPTRLTAEGCDAIELVDGPAGALVATGGERVVLWGSDGLGGLAEREVVATGLTGTARLAARDELLALTTVGSTSIREWGPQGVSTLATGGPVGDVALGPLGWTWTLPEVGAVVDLSRHRVAVDDSPSTLVAEDLDGDGQRDLVLLDPSRGRIRVLAGGGPALVVQRAERVSSLAVGDATGDGCPDLVIGAADPPGVTVLPTTCHGPRPVPAPAPEAQVRSFAAPPDLAVPAPGPWTPPPAIDPPPRVLGIPVTKFLGDGVAMHEERVRPQRYVLFGSGWAMGSTLRNVWFEIPFFPALSVELEIGSPSVRWFVGGDSAALFFWVTESGGGIHLMNLSAGVTFGSPRLRTGPFVTAGLVNAGAGIRTVFTPWEDRSLGVRGLEMRLTWFYPGTGEVMFLYVWSQPMRRARRGRVPAPLPDVVVPEPAPVAASPEAGGEPAPEAPPDDRVAIQVIGDPTPRKVSRAVACRRFGASIGVAAAASSTRHSWQFVGSDVPVTPSGSPVIALGCETGGKHAGLFLGVETAPFLSYLTPWDDKLHHMGSHTVGLMVGGDGFRFGPIAQLGIWTAGAGMRATARIHTDKRELIHRLEFRAVALYPSAPAGEVMLLYGFEFDPWK